MAGINLSQSIQEKQAIARGGFFDAGFFINTTILLLVLGAYGGSSWYLGTLEDKLTALQTATVEKQVALRGAKVNRVADFQQRIDTITESLEAGSDPRMAFKDLEQAVLPTIRLTAYEDRSEEGKVIKGVTTNLRFLAQQMLLFKKMEGVQSVHADIIEYTETGEIKFALTLMPTPPEPTAS